MSVTGNQSIELATAAELYTVDYQPTYDLDDLQAAQAELQLVPPAASITEILSLREQLWAIATGNVNTPLIIDGRCAEPVAHKLDFDKTRELIWGLAHEALTGTEIVRSVLPDALSVKRAGKQSSKPRSSYIEQTPSGPRISFMGEGINSQDPDQRIPDASRMVSSAQQGIVLKMIVDGLTNNSVPFAHEALLLPSEQAYMHTDPATGGKFLLSTALPWIGERTRGIDGPHVDMLADVVNPVGVKIGPNATGETIKQLTDRLNPDREPGKLIFMIRMGTSRQIPSVLGGIREASPGSIIAHDIHGVTKLREEAGKTIKLRAVEDIITEIQDLAEACAYQGLVLHGTHLETRLDDPSRLECVYTTNETPTHPGGVDPQLNRDQFARVLEGTQAAYMRR